MYGPASIFVLPPLCVRQIMESKRWVGGIPLEELESLSRQLLGVFWKSIK